MEGVKECFIQLLGQNMFQERAWNQEVGKSLDRTSSFVKAHGGVNVLC